MQNAAISVFVRIVVYEIITQSLRSWLFQQSVLTGFFRKLHHLVPALLIHHYYVKSSSYVMFGE